MAQEDWSTRKWRPAMGAVLGVAAYGRTQEKLNGVTTPPSIPATPSVPTPAPIPRAITPAPAVMPLDPPERITRND